MPKAKSNSKYQSEGEKKKKALSVFLKTMSPGRPMTQMEIAEILVMVFLLVGTFI